MKVTLLSTNDSTGGAAVVTTRLLNALRREGVDARMLVGNKVSTNPYIEAVGSRTQRSWAFLRERVGIFRANGMRRSELFSVSTADAGIALASHPLVRQADVIVLGWINQGFLSLKGLAALGRLGKPIVWVMHDMWCLTGICHHAHYCRGYHHCCGCCPKLHSHRPDDLSFRTWRQKLHLYDTFDIHFVAVSNWLRERARQSSLMEERDVRVIPNPVPIDSFHIAPKGNTKLSVLDYSKNNIVMAAQRLDDPIKGLEYAIDAVNRLFIEHPELTKNTELLLAGAIRDHSLLDRIRFPFRHLGYVNDMDVLREIYSGSKVVLSTSLYETLPGTLIEGQASGCLPVTFGVGGQLDIVDHLKNGYIAEYKDAESVAQGILWALQQDTDRQALSNSVRARFSSSVIAQQYIELFNELLNHNDIS